MFHWQEAAWTTCLDPRRASSLSSTADVAKDEHGKVRPLPRADPGLLKVSIWCNQRTFSTPAVSPCGILELPGTGDVCESYISPRSKREMFIVVISLLFCYYGLYECKGGFFSFWLGVSLPRAAPVEYHMRTEHWFRSQTVTLTHWPDGSDDDPWGHDECIFHKGTVHTLLFTTIAHKKSFLFLLGR